MGNSNSTPSGPPLIPADVIPIGDPDFLPFLSKTNRISLCPSQEPGWTAAGAVAAFLHKREDYSS